MLTRFLFALLLSTLCVDASAEDKDASTILLAWSRLPEAQRNRVLDPALAPDVQSALRDVLGRGVRPCDCYTRRIRWAWALPDPRDPAHPALVVAFSDPPRDQTHVAYYARFAHLRFVETRYSVSSAFVLKRPAMSERNASLSVRIKPRRDLDQDGQVDIAVSFSELWRNESFCGSASFPSSGAQLNLEERACDTDAAPELLE